MRLVLVSTDGLNFLACASTASVCSYEARGSRTGCVRRFTVSTFCANTSSPESTTVSTSCMTPWKSGVNASTDTCGVRRLMARMASA